jgi:tRNA pseudouridine55 synthase
VCKTVGPTSHDVVDMARRALGERRIGHTGTLDPMAEGLLLLCVGQATRLQQYLMRWEKAYRGEIRLGYATTTYEGEGAPADPRGTPPELDPSTLRRLEQRFTGMVQQIPPPYSAKKVAGKKLYEFARDGQHLVVDAKQVTVHELHLEQVERDLLGVEVRTSTGLYVRTLAHDLGTEIGCGAHLHRLCRVAIGPYSTAAALPQRLLDDAETAAEITGHPLWIPLDRIALPFPGVSLNAAATERFVHGQEVIVFRNGREPLASGSEVASFGPDGQLLGVGQVQAVLARGRTVSLSPAVVLPRGPAEPTIAKGETS